MVLKEIEVLRKVYEHLGDEESKYYFEKRLLYNITNDKKYVRDMVQRIPFKKDLDLLIEKVYLCKKKLVLWGCGRNLSDLLMLYPDLKYDAICDSSLKRQRDGWNGMHVLSPKELKYMDDYQILITSTLYEEEIRKNIQELQIVPEHIWGWSDIHNNIRRIQYFEPDLLVPRENEVFVDAGCYDGSTSVLFAEWCHQSYERIYAFEPDDANRELCQKTFCEKHLENVELVPKGSWSSVTVLKFRMKNSAASMVVPEDENDSDSVSIDVTTIDEVVGSKRVTLIKMDIEGAELEALKGAKNTIAMNHPKLAICIYHKPEDIVEIPEYILSLWDGYKFYIRHYNVNENETVLYAL